jgi:hypothetical protein
MFCLFEAARPPGLAGAPPGPAGLGEVRALHLGGPLWAAVADAPADRVSDAAIRRTLASVDRVGAAALAHEAVVRYVFRRRAVLPFKLFTIYGGDERARAELDARRERLLRLLADLRHREEWGVTIAPGRPRPAPPAARRSGRAYLDARRQALAPRRRSLAAAAERLVTALAPGTAARTVSARDVDQGGPAVSAAFLLDRGRRDTWRARLRRTRARLEADGWVVSATGPWPPYHFVRMVDGD